VERGQLEDGKMISKKGLEKFFGRKMISVLIPLLDNDELEGILYLYIPLENISELTHDFTILWLLRGVIFITIALMLGYILINRLTRPLDEMKRAAQKVSSGDY